MNSAARSGFVAVAPVADTVEAEVVSTNYYRFPGQSIVSYQHNLTAAIANFLKARMKHSGEVNYVETIAADDQTGNRFNGGNAMHYTIPKGKLLGVDADNGNNAQYECILLAIGDAPSGLTTVQPAQLPPGGRWIRGTGSSTHTAGAWSECAMTWSEDFTEGKRYRQHGMRAVSATAYGARMAYKEKQNVAFKPGCPAGDTRALAPAFWASFPDFDGQFPPNVEMLSSGADTSQFVDIYITG